MGQHRLMLILGASVLASAIAGAQPRWCTGFEPPLYRGLPQGVPLNGQDGWQGSGWNPFLVFTYRQNALSIPPNPNGESQFIGAEGAGHEPPPVAQHEFDWVNAPGWTVRYDFCIGAPGEIAVPARIGRFSLEPLSSAIPIRNFQSCWQWHSDRNPAAGFDILYAVYNADGSAQPLRSPGAAWQQLRADRWYRLRTTFDFITNRILKIAITDLQSRQTTVAFPQGWYLQGGARTTAQYPTGLSFALGFTPGPLAGNRLAIDNLCIFPAVPADVDGDGCVDDRDLLQVLMAFGGTGDGLPEDLNGDGVVDDADLLMVLFSFGTGC